MKRILVYLLCGLAFSGCAAIPLNLKTPEITFVGLKAIEASVFEQKLEVRLKVVNPNSMELPVNGLDVDIELAGEPFAHGVSAREFVVPALGEAEFDMNVTANAATARKRLNRSRRKSPIWFFSIFKCPKKTDLKSSKRSTRKRFRPLFS